MLYLRVSRDCRALARHGAAEPLGEGNMQTTAIKTLYHLLN